MQAFQTKYLPNVQKGRAGHWVPANTAGIASRFQHLRSAFRQPVVSVVIAAVLNERQILTKGEQPVSDLKSLDKTLVRVSLSKQNPG